MVIVDTVTLDSNACYSTSFWITYPLQAYDHFEKYLIGWSVFPIFHQFGWKSLDVKWIRFVCFVAKMLFISRWNILLAGISVCVSLLWIHARFLSAFVIAFTTITAINPGCCLRSPMPFRTCYKSNLLFENYSPSRLEHTASIHKIIYQIHQEDGVLTGRVSHLWM